MYQPTSKNSIIVLISVALVIAAVLIGKNQNSTINKCDVAIINTKIWTSNRESPWANSMVVHNGKRFGDYN